MNLHICQGGMLSTENKLYKKNIAITIKGNPIQRKVTKSLGLVV